MTRLGKAALILTVLALGGGFYLAAMLITYHNQWSVKLAKARTDTEKAIADRDQAAIDLDLAQAELARTKLGWGYEWTLPGGAPPAVQVQGGRLSVNGVGEGNGLTRRAATDDQGQQQSVAPVVHVFTPDGQGGSVYLGEFIADTQLLTATSCVLIPTWNVSPQEIQSWNFSNGARLRSQIPMAERAAVEGANRLIQRTRELIAQANRNIAEQQNLLAAVQAQLDFRRKELLGNPDLQRIEDRPEYSDGLVKALVDIEEERNAIQVAVDELRRIIKDSSDQRDMLISQLNSLVAQLPQPDSLVSQKPE